MSGRVVVVNRGFLPLSEPMPRDIAGSRATVIGRVRVSDSRQFGEIDNYHYANNSCDAGQMCGHYTQLVWRDSVRIGCAVHRCSPLPGFGPADLIVCEYDPPGNWVGEKPY